MGSPKRESPTEGQKPEGRKRVAHGVSHGASRVVLAPNTQP